MFSIDIHAGRKKGKEGNGQQMVYKDSAIELFCSVTEQSRRIQGPASDVLPYLTHDGGRSVGMDIGTWKDGIRRRE
jgi:hypothetical protein